MKFDERASPSESHTFVVPIGLDSVESLIIRVFERLCNLFHTEQPEQRLYI